MTLNTHLLDRAAIAAAELLDDEPTVYGRVCDRCGHLEVSADPLLVVGHRECPNCTVRLGRDHAVH